jgi:hypothetical protein
MRPAYLFGTLAAYLGLTCSQAWTAEAVKPSLSQWGGPLFMAQQPAQPPQPPAQVVTGPGTADPDLTSLESLETSTPPELLGDASAIIITRPTPTPLSVSPIITIPGTPSSPTGPNISSRRVLIVPSVRTFKITDNESPIPQDRFYLSFNYVNDFADALNRRIGADVRNINLYRETFGLEKTILDGRGSIGFRVPLDSMTAKSGDSAVDGDHTSFGDLSTIFKYILWQNEPRNRIVSAGLAITAPTGPAGFAGVDPLFRRHSTSFQPFMGYLARGDNWYLQGFLALDVPTDARDVTVLFNAIGLGYYV